MTRTKPRAAAAPLVVAPRRRFAAALHRRTALACAALLGGCLGGQTGQEDEARRPIDCAIEQTPLAADAATELGFTAAELETSLAEPVSSSMNWWRMDQRSELTLTVLEVRARHLNRSTNGACADTLGLDALVSIESADGLLDERLDAVVESDAVDHANIVAEVAMDDIAGALTAQALDLDLRIWRDPKFSFRFELGAEPRLRGEITLDGDDPDRSDDESPVSAAIAELPAP